MKSLETNFRRRALLATGLGAGILMPVLARAASLTGFAPIDSPAIPVLNPTGVLLLAIARAGARLVAVGEHGVIIYSDDSGVSWVQAHVPVDATLTCVAFATPQIGWAAGHFGVILKTTDGGKSWIMQLNGVQANQITMAAAQAAASQNNTSPGAPLAVRRAQAFESGGPDKPFLCMLAFDSNKVIVFGAYRMTMQTLDGGKSWSDISLEIFDRLSHNLYGATVVGSDIYVVAETGLVFCSSDGGKTFPQVTPAAEVSLFGVIGANDGSIIAYGVAGAIFRSTDAGKTWTAVNINTQDNFTAALKLASGAILVAIESGGLFLSKDNGNTFTPVSGVPPRAIFDLASAPDNTLVSVGSAGVTKLPADLSI